MKNEELFVQDELSAAANAAETSLFYQQELDKVKEELHVMSEQEAKLKDIGSLAEILGKDMFNPEGVSLEKRLESGEILEEDVEQLLTLVSQSYVKPTDGAALRCVDGRVKEGYDDADPTSYGEPLGPQVQGGTVDEAVAQRLDEGYEAGATLVEDTKQQAEKESRFSPGGHFDTHGPLGCGAVKGQEAKLSYYADALKFEAAKKGVFALAEIGGSELPKDSLDHLPAAAATLKEHQDSYYGDKTEALKVVEDLNPAGKIKLEGQHNEVVVVVNFEDGTTLHTNHLNALTEGRLQAFGLDAWRIKSPTVLMDAITTLMNLTDGSLRLVVRKSA